LDALEYNDFQFEIDVKSTPSVPFKDENYQYIDTVEAFQQLIEELRTGNHTEIAVDLEHHNIRSYQGFTCLMQVNICSIYFSSS
jgi:exosome complex exonuclease RRP6